MKPTSLRLVCIGLLLLWSCETYADAEDEFSLARNLFRDAGDYATAAQLFSDFIRNHPADPHLADARLMLAQAYGRSNRCTEAVGAYRDFYEAHPNHLDAAKARLEQATCYETLGDLARAGTIYEEVQRLYSESEYAAESLLSAATNFVRAGDVANGLRAYGKLLKAYDGHGAARRGRYRLAQLKVASGDPGGARELLGHITAGAPDSDEARDALLLAGRLELFLGRASVAQERFKQLQGSFATSLHADSSRLAMAAHHRGRGQYDLAEAAYEEAAKKANSPTLEATALLGRADALRDAGRHEQALGVYRDLMSLKSARSMRDETRLGMAISLGWLRQVGPAVSELFQLVNTSDAAPAPAHAAALRELGALYRRQGDLARAISWFRRYLDETHRHGGEFPESASEQDLARLQLAEVYGASGYHDEAIRLFGELSHDSALQAEGQYGLATAYEGSSERRLAVREYVNFLERFPGHRRSTQVRNRVEYLREFMVRDAEGLAKAVQQALIDELSGGSRHQVRYNLAEALRHHQDFPNAVRVWEAYVAAYPEDPGTREAQFYLADCLYRLARQRQLEGEPTAADSLKALARQEDRILGGSTPVTRWSRLAQLRQVERAAAEAASDSARYRIEEQGYATIVAEGAADEVSADARTRALLLLGDARRAASATHDSLRSAATEAYALLLKESAGHPLAERARFGLAVNALEGGNAEGAIDSLTTLLQDVPGSQLQPQILAVLADALRRAGRVREGASRLSELLLAFPTYEGQRLAQEQLADTYLELGDHQRAAELYTQLGDSDPSGDTDGSLRQRLARAHDRAGQFELSLSVYDRLLVEGITAGDSVHVARGTALSRLGRTEEAIEAYRRVRSTGPLTSSAALLAADLLFATGDYAAAARAYGPLAEETSAPPALVGRWVLSLFEQGQAEQTKKARDRFRKRFGKDQQPWAFLFELYEGRRRLAAREYDKAFELFAKLEDEATAVVADESTLGSAVAVDLARTVADPVGAAAYYAATTRWQQMRAEPSEEGAQVALKLQGDFLSAHGAGPFAPTVRLRLGDFNFALGTYRQSAGAYRDVLDGPQSSQSQRQEGIWKLLQCYQKLSEHDESLRLSRRLLSQFPDHPKRNSAEIEVGVIYEETGRYSEAIETLNQVLEWAEGDDAAEARYHIGQAYQKLGDYRSAIKIYYEVSYHGAEATTNWIVSADFARARCHEELAEPAQARSVYDKIIRTAGASSEFGRLAQQRIDAL
ncbi:MAG TPA: tetratricopeptide repeat protein [Candidatus Latescibacteria bacterium]|nr:tetratricopeptide repeat protein [Candidatus Latescibacterota bacterium]HJN26768.1 tetratricopeptide repeat protein [Candidatus Latescibacterota bacterium]